MQLARFLASAIQPGLIGTLLVCGSLGASAQQTTNGRDSYVGYGCYQCHGYEGQGGVAGPRVAPTPYPFAAFEQLVRRPANVMPAYSSAVLDDETLREIYEFVSSVPPPAEADEIPALR